MTGYVTILRREVWRRRQLFGLAAALAVLAVLMPLLPGLESYAAEETRGAASALFALLLGLVVAVVMGGAVCGRDLSEGRFGFDFARPVSGVAIWAGRLTAAIAVVLGVEMVALLPALVSDIAGIVPSMAFEFVPISRLMRDRGEVGLLLAAFVVMPLVILLTVHVVGTSVRARSPWLALDAVGLVAAVTLGGLALGPFVREVQVVPGLIVGMMLLSAIAGGLLTASWAQVTRGRADLGRAHRWGALVGWPVLGSGLVAVAMYAGWLWDVRPGDLRGVSIRQVGAHSTWFVMEGEEPRRWGLRAEFAVNARDGRSVRLDAVPGMYRTLFFLNEREGAIRREFRGTREVLSFLDLSAEALGEQRELVSFQHDNWFMVSPSGGLLVYSNGTTILGVDVDSGDHLAGTRTIDRELADRVPEQPAWDRVAFVGADVVRIATWGWRPDTSEKTVEVFDFDFRRDVETPVAEMVVDGWTELTLTRHGTVLWLSRDDIDVERRRGYRLPDLQPVAGTPDPSDRDGRWRRLSDDRIVRTEELDDHTVVVIAEADGTITTRVEFPGARWLTIGPELSGHRVLVWGVLEDDAERSFEVAVLDVATAHMEPIGHDLRPPYLYGWRSSPTGPADAVLFTTSTDEVVRWNADTGELTTVPGFERDEG